METRQKPFGEVIEELDREIRSWQITVENRDAEILHLKAELEAVGAGGAQPLRASPVSPVGAEEMTRFCPECGSIGPVSEGASDCCPDGSHARIVPKQFAAICRATFQSSLATPAAPAAVAVGEREAMESALRHCEHLLMAHSIDRADHEAIEDEALKIIRAALATTQPACVVAETPKLAKNQSETRMDIGVDGGGRFAPAVEYPALPEALDCFYDEIDKEEVNVYSDYQMRAYADATHAMRASTCAHRIADARNSAVESGYLCTDCGAVFAAADHGVMRAGEQEPVVNFPHEQMDALALARYKVVPSDQSMYWRHAVVAGDGQQHLYNGSKVDCQNMARKFAGAFLDGAFAFHSRYTSPVATQGEQPMVNMTPPATSRDRWMYEQGRLAERDARTPESVAATELDAKRYRWLRNESWACYNLAKKKPEVALIATTRDGAGNIKTILAEEAMDAAIDAALSATTPPVATTKEVLDAT